MKKIDIALATYNGSSFLTEQIDSILNQTYSEISLFFSDDGSKDDTVLKIKKIADHDKRMHICNTKRVGGVVLNFEKALEFSQAEYIMFSDQDDVWLPDKIESMLNFIMEKENQLGSEIPILCFSDLTLVDENLNVIADSFYKANKLNPLNNININFLLWRSTVYGCSCIFNRACLQKALPFPANIPMHDHWLALIAAKYGSVFFYEKSTILYRQHSNNVIGGAAFNKSLFYKFKRAKKLISGVKRAHQGSIAMRKIIGDDRGKIEFFFDCIWPYIYEKKLFSFIFIFFHFFRK